MTSFDINRNSYRELANHLCNAMDQRTFLKVPDVADWCTDLVIMQYNDYTITKLYTFADH